MSTEFYKTAKPTKENKDHTYEKIESTKHKDTILGLVTLNEQKGAWVSDAGLKITAQKGKIVATINTGEGNSLRSIVRIFEPSAKLDSFSIKDSKVNIDVKVSEEEEAAAQLMEQVKNDVKEPIYKKHKMKLEQGVWVFRDRASKEWSIIDVNKDDKDETVVVVESSIHKSMERVDTKKFNLNNELSSFDSATDYTEHRQRPIIDLSKEENAMNELLSKPNVKLRAKASEQQEFKKYHAS